jgi:phospholipid transport system substrate-binding protein
MTNGISRRGFLGGAAAAAIVPEALAAGEHPSLAYMKVVARDLLNAHRQGTVSSFLRAIQRHADVANIANYSLGEYKSKLKNGQQARYYRGVATFMARYFADQSREYPVAKYQVGEATVDAGKDILVTSKVFLMSGQIYSVTWRLVWRKGGYKVADAKMLGFSLVYLQRGIFQSYLSKRNGDVNALVAALNR